MLPLRELQLRFLAALTPGGPGNPASGGGDPTLLDLVNGAGALGPAERLGIYADMYRSRLVDVLREDFPRTAAILGDEAFWAAAGRYLARHPSTHPSVRYVGRRFADFLAAEPDAPPFLGDLARLEWARVEVFDAADGEPLRLSDLADLSPEQWPTLRFRPIPASRIVEAAWPVHAIWAQAEERDPTEVPAPAPSVIRVWREGWSVSHAAAGATERRLLPLLERAEPFAALCAAFGEEQDSEVAAREVGGLLMRWIEDGFLARALAE